MTSLSAALRFIVPPNSETRWTDLLATLVEVDSEPLRRLLGYDGHVGVRREVVVPGANGRSDRLDLLLERDDAAPAAVTRWIGHGFGQRLARKQGACMFGARFALPPSSTLSEVDAELRQLESLVQRMAADVD